MEKSKEYTLFKGRSSRWCIRTGYQRFTADVRRIVADSWIAAVAYGICFSTLITARIFSPGSVAVVAAAILLGAIAEIMLYASGMRRLAPVNGKAWPIRMAKSILASFLVAVIVSAAFAAAGWGLAETVNRIGGRMMIPPLWGIIALGTLGCLLLLPLMQGVMGYLFVADRRLWSYLWHGYRLGMKHWGKWFVVALITMIVTALLSIIIILPANILSIANLQSQAGIALGDKAGMPSYIIYMTAGVMFLAGIVEVYIRLSMLYVCHVTAGSNEEGKDDENGMNIEVKM